MKIICVLEVLMFKSVSLLLQVSVFRGENSKDIGKVLVFDLGEQSQLNVPGFIGSCLPHYPVDGHQEENGRHGTPLSHT